MTTILDGAERFRRTLCWALAVAMATAPSNSTYAQTNAAAMSVRQRVEGGLAQGPESSPPQSALGLPPGQSILGQSGAGKLDMRYIAPTSAVIAIVRPAQILASPFAQVFPVEVASAAGVKYLGFDPAEMEEVVAFGDASNPVAPTYGTTFKFKDPIRATSIAPERRAHAQLAELGGKKYLRSSVPMLYSLYGPNNKTLIASPDDTLQKLVASKDQPKTGPLVDRIREVPAGNDLYIAVDLATLRPFIQMRLMQAQANLPPETKQYTELLNQISAVELTLNVSAPGPSSLIIHCNDDAATQQIEAVVQEMIQKAKSKQAEQLAGGDALTQAMGRYFERMWQPFTPQRNGTSITCFHIDGQNPGQQQLVNVAVIGAAMALAMPAVQAARHAAARQHALQPGMEAAPGGPEAPSTPEAAPQP